MSRKIIIVTLCAGALWLTACSGSGNGATEKEAQASGEAGHKEEHENPNTVTFSQNQINSIGIRIGGIETKQLTSSLKTNGTLRVPNQNKATVNSLYSGVIRTLLVQPGNTVNKGQVIATISNPSFVQSQSEYLSVMTRLKLAEQEVTRQRELTAGNAGALKNLQAAETAFKTLQTEKSTLGQQIRMMGINPEQLSNGKLISSLSVLSPISGVVSDVKVQIGSYVDLTSPIADIVDNSQLHLDLFVYEKDLSKLREGQTIHFTLTNNPGKEYDAEIFSLGSTFEGESKAVTVHAKVKGDKAGLIDGMNITAIISLEKATVQAIPTDAIVNYQGQDYIFFVTDEHAEDEHHQGAESGHDHSSGETHDHTEEGGKKAESNHGTGMTFEKIPVVKGTTDIGYTEITLLKEIPAGSKIVVKGAFFVLAKMTNAGEGHEH
ncbi:efflux RND transporter periplasmic adaptor subunit [Chitinophaga oryzae]|uniref:Efflux RND transporter periplasmic adaptor subunit n=1 Tax=Chitinophaga oryzae TaxID=2725414 RepID=A0ABX6LB12_9BACT|nr:efflux RND transporter periplasmic adaptor subunit [Chitinophaga oryzae]QJB37257.1 efflux RND transporter periplasmic adaptor subunit [Chitinophaga oryzae]